MAIGIVVMSLMLRPVATEVGPVLAMVQSDLHLGGTLAGLVGSLPPACFAVFGFATPPLVQRLGIHRTLVLALVALLVGGLARAFADGSIGFIAWSALALAGAAICNVLAPSLIRLHFGGRIALMTALFSLGISVGAATGVISYPLALALGGWRTSFAVMSSTMLVAVLLWLRTWQFDRRATPSGTAPQPNPPSVPSTRPSLGRVARTRLGWCMAIYFGAQSAQAYSMLPSCPRSSSALVCRPRPGPTCCC